jgi:hypothetical protein
MVAEVEEVFDGGGIWEEVFPGVLELFIVWFRVLVGVVVAVAAAQPIIRDWDSHGVLLGWAVGLITL